MTKNEFFDKCNKFGINISKYDYSEIPDKIVNKEIVYITCKQHNHRFPQLVQNHIRGYEGCKICNSLKQSKSRTKSQEQFIKDAIKVWNDKNNYDNVEYFDANKDAKNIFCNIHKKYFNQNANQHLRGHEGCDLCKSENRSKFQTKPIINFIDDANIVWNKINTMLDTNYKFDYSKTVYEHSQKYVTIKCLKHNKEFQQNPHGHLQGHLGCPICKQEFTTSGQEQEIIQFIKQFYSGNIIQNYRDIKNGISEIDIFLPELSIGIEFNGLYWHSTEFKTRNYHLQKTINCEKQNIRLIHIFEDEWLWKKDIVKSRIMYILGYALTDSNHKIFARKLKLKQITNIQEEKLFLEANHIQGYSNSEICYGLYYTSKNTGKDILVSLMSFCKPRFNSNYEWELLRFCNAKFCSIPGAAQKLFSHFIKTIKPKSIISYAKRNWSINNEHNVYNKLGFNFQNYSDPDFYYIKNLHRYNRSIGRADKRNNLTEIEWMKLNGYSKIYGTGNLVYIWK